MTLPIVPTYLSVTQRPLLLWPQVMADYDRQLRDYRLSLGEGKLLSRFKRMKKGQSTLTPKQMADQSVTLTRLPEADAALPDDQAPHMAEMAIEGPLLHKASWMQTDMGPLLIMDGYDRIRSVISELGSSDHVKGILIRMDTPGGMVNGLSLIHI